MTGTEWAAILVVVIPSLVAGLGFLMKASREAGRADEYRRTSELTILAQGKEIEQAKMAIEAQRLTIEEMRGWNR